MNHREPPHRAAGERRALRYLSLLLLPALVPKNVSGVSRTRPIPGAPADLRDAEPALAPYLAALGAPPLRFETALPPPDLTRRPAPVAPPPPPPAVAEPPSALVEAKSLPAAAVNAASSEAVATNSAKPAPAPAKVPPPSIIPDDARPSIRPEDFLPYFEIPGTGRQPGDVRLLVPAPRGAPAPAPLPPSSATYTQSK